METIGGFREAVVGTGEWASGGTVGWLFRRVSKILAAALLSVRGASCRKHPACVNEPGRRESRTIYRTFFLY
jgi:hypothetical protein